MTMWGHYLRQGRIADTLESLEGKFGIYLEKGDCFAVLIFRVKIAMGNGSLELIQLDKTGSMQPNSNFKLMTPLKNFELTSSSMHVDSARLVYRSNAVMSLMAQLRSGASVMSIREQIDLIELDEFGLDNSEPYASEDRPSYIYLAITSDKLALDAYLPATGRLIQLADQNIVPFLLIFEQALRQFPELAYALVETEREYCRSAGTKPVIGYSMNELFGDDQGARWAFGCRAEGLCASSLMSGEDLIRLLLFVGNKAGWPVEINSWPTRSLSHKCIRTYRIETRWQK